MQIKTNNLININVIMIITVRTFVRRTEGKYYVEVKTNICINNNIPILYLFFSQITYITSDNVFSLVMRLLFHQLLSLSVPDFLDNGRRRAQKHG